MTDRYKKLIRNRTTVFLIFTSQAGKQITCHTAIRESNAALDLVMLERMSSEST